MRKRSVMLALLLLPVLLLTACGDKDDTAVSAGAPQTFTATVLESEETILLVCPDEDMSEYKSSNQIHVGMAPGGVILNTQGEEIPRGELSAGQRVQITYDGLIRETYPAGITASRVEVVA